MRPWSSRFRGASVLLACALGVAAPSRALAGPLLVSDGGKKIRSAAKWELLRRAEVATALGARAGYGALLATDLESFAAKESAAEETVLDGKAVLKRAKIAATTRLGTIFFDVACFIPRGGRVSAAPAFLMVGTPDWKEKLDPSIAEMDDEFWPVATIVSRGCAAASFAADQAAEPGATNCVAKWAAAARAARAWMSSDARLDAARVTIVGHSAAGEAAMWAFAADRDFAALCCTAERSLKRRGEDFRDLLSLAAPRPVFLASGASDVPVGATAPEETAAVDTAAVWALYGVKPGVVHRARPGVHGIIRADWEFFLEGVGGMVK